ncbi:MAG: hypothetical protein WBW72_05560 [Erwinia billingiae]
MTSDLGGCDAQLASSNAVPTSASALNFFRLVAGKKRRERAMIASVLT